MKGIVLAGGSGSRLDPLTRVTNKHLLPVYDRPMIYYPITTLKEAGITDILVVTGGNDPGHFMKLLGSGRELGVHLEYVYQEGAGGIAAALSLAEGFAGNELVAVILGDNILEENIGWSVASFERRNEGARVHLSPVLHPERFGVAVIENNQIQTIIEKPEEHAGNMAVTGLYFYDPDVFIAITTLKPSGRGELEVTDLNNLYILDKSLDYVTLRGRWTDAGTFESLAEANRIAREVRLRSQGASQ